MGGVHRPAVPRPGASHHGRRERVGGDGDRWAPLEDGAPRLPGGLLASVTASDGVRQEFTTLFDYGVFDLFPRLKVLVLESGGGWLGYWLDRIDAVYGHTFIGDRVPLEHKPSDYVREQVWISCDPDERTIPHLAERFGADRFLWASDFPTPMTPQSTSTT